MNAATRLIQLREKATPGEWERSTVAGDEATIWTHGSGGAVAWINFEQWTGSHHPDGDAALIISLVNATPQLTALIQAAEELRSYQESGSPGYLEWDAKFEAMNAALADLDLGGGE